MLAEFANSFLSVSRGVARLGFAATTANVALDLGTANARLALPREGVVIDEPTVVATVPGESRLLSGSCAVGHLARQLLGRAPQSIGVTSPLRDGVVADAPLCEAMLRYWFMKTRVRRLATRPRVLLAVSAGATSVARRTLADTVLRAGARQVWLIDQTKAAAIGLGLPMAEPTASMLCDMGAAHARTAIFSLGEVVSSHIDSGGGAGMDASLADHFKRHYRFRMGPQTAEQLRIELGSAMPGVERATEVRGVDCQTGLPRKLRVTSAEVREGLADSLDKIVQSVRATLDGCPVELAADLSDEGLVLCGGAAQLPRLDAYLTRETGLPVRLAVDASHAVVLGTLACVEQFDRYRHLLAAQ